MPKITYKRSVKAVIDHLNCDSIEVKPRDIDWQKAAGPDGDGWRSFEASRCEKCNAVVVLSAGDGEQKHRDLHFDVDDATCPKCNSGDVSDCAEGCDGKDDAPAALHCGECGNTWVDPRECDGWIGLVEGPMMNYWYAVEIEDCETAAQRIADLPLCVVQFDDDETGLALTGGGMDLSWEICEAFILLDYMPPVHFSRLPNMAGKTLTPRNRITVAACVKSNQIAKRWADSRIADLKRLRSAMRAQTKKPAQK